MSAGQQALRIDVGDGAGGSDIHVAANEDRADGRARLERLRLLHVADGADAHDRNDSGCANCGANMPDGLFAEKPLKTSGVSMGFR